MSPFTCLLDLNRGMSGLFNGFALIKDAKDGVATNSSPYFDLTLGKQNKTVMGKLWENKFGGFSVPELKEVFKGGNLLYVEGRVGEYKNNLQIAIENFRLAEEGEVDISEYLMVAPESLDSMIAEFEAFIDDIQTPILKDITTSIYQDNKKAFVIHPAGKAVHHDFYSGLIYHELSMLRIGKSLCDQYPQLNRDLVYSGIALHDMGKVVELGFEGFVPSYTTTGSFLGHITIVNMLIDRKIQAFAQEKKYVRKEYDKAIQLMHIVSSHHGDIKLGYGSAMTPALLEAEVIHYIDMIDSRINIITKGLADKTEGEFHKLYPMGAFYKQIGE